MKLYSLDEMLDKCIGEKGTESRDSFEKELKKDIDTREFKVGRLGSTYLLPKYKVEPGQGLVKTGESQVISFVKGNIEGPEFKQDGIITENLLSMLIEHLGSLNVGDLRNRHTSVAITKLEEALMWIEERKNDRAKRGVQGTYKK